MKHELDARGNCGYVTELGNFKHCTCTARSGAGKAMNKKQIKR